MAQVPGMTAGLTSAAGLGHLTASQLAAASSQAGLGAGTALQVNTLLHGALLCMRLYSIRLWYRLITPILVLETDIVCIVIEICNNKMV